MILVAGMAFGAASAASAYCAPGSPYKWATASPHDVFASTNGIPQTWNSALSASATGWNGVTGSNWSFRYYTWGTYGPPYQGGWIYRGATSAGVPGETVNSVFTQGGSNIVWAYTTLSSNSSFTWNTTGTMNQAAGQVDVRTVTFHELGHWLRLRHPSDCGQSVSSAVMEPNWTKKWSLATDDRNGIAFLY